MGQGEGGGGALLAGGARAEKVVMGWACLENERLFLGVESQLLAGFRLDAGREDQEQGHEAIARPAREVGGRIAAILYDCWRAQLG